MQPLYQFVFHYPLFMAFLLMFGAIIYDCFRERKPDIDHLPETPLVSILIPCHNEQECIRETIGFLDNQTYPNLEIIAIDDASTDGTLAILREMAAQRPRLRILSMRTNQGKGMGLTLAALAARGEYLVCIDADALLDHDAVRYILWHFLHFPRVGAVTGNPRVRNRTSMLGKIQVGEYSSIVGMIKRTQRVVGKIFTVSGVICAFRKRALQSVNYWSNDMYTEDIDISWKLNLAFWDIRYEPRALCWILMPETLRGLWKQRLRWARGGSEVLKKYTRHILSWSQRRIWPVYLEYGLSVVWAYGLALTVFFFLLGQVVPLPEGLRVQSILPGWTGMILSIACLMQIALGLILDSRFEPKLWRLFFWLIWYPAIYWILNAAVTIVGFPQAMARRPGVPAVWESPDRGVHHG